MDNNYKYLKKRIIGYLIRRKFFLMLSIFFLCCIFLTSYILPRIIQLITDRGIMLGNMRFVIQMTMLFIFITIVSNLIKIYQEYILVNMHNEISAMLYNDSFYVVYHSKDLLKDISISGVINSLDSDIEVLSDFVGHLLSFFFMNIAELWAGIFGIGSINIELSTIILVLVPLRLLIIHRLSKRKQHLTKRYLFTRQHKISGFNDLLNGLKDIVLFINAKDFLSRTAKYVADENDAYRNYKMLDQVKISFEDMMDNIFLISFYLIGGYFVIKNKVSLGEIFSLISYSLYIVGPLTSLFNVKYYLSQIKPSAERYIKFLDKYGYNKYPIVKKEKVNKFRPEQILSLVCKDVTFSYKTGKNILNSISFCMSPGEKMILCGKNGSGKSTLFDLICGILTPFSGRILINNIDVKDFLRPELNEYITYISQDSYIFNETIKNNIDLVGIYSTGEVILACEKSGASEFIDKLPKKYNEILKGSGSSLSKGQINKILVARAILKKSRIIIFDEVDSSLDYDSKKNLLQLLNNEFSDCMVIISTHSPQIYKSIGNTYELENGKLSRIHV